jgi:hypothetical protein
MGRPGRLQALPQLVTAWLTSLRPLRFLLVGSVKLIKSASKLIEHC